MGVGVGGQVGRLLLYCYAATGQVAQITGCYALALLNTREAAMVYSVLCRAGGGQELHGSLKGGSHF